MDPAYTYVAAPGAPLHPVSPERANQQKRSRPEIPPSPSLPNIPGFAQALMSADVRSKVAQFNSLDTKDVTERRRGHEAALRRAVLGREEAENETKRAKEEIEELNHELEEYKRREEKVARRLERAMEELHHYKDKLQQTKETHLHYQSMYEKEIRRMRKEAFKSSSALVKLQEELKAARESLAEMRIRMEEQKSKAEERDKAAFNASYKLVEVQQELARMREAIRLVEQERDALKTSLKEEEIARVAAQGNIDLPVSFEMNATEYWKTTSVDDQLDNEERLEELEWELRAAHRALKDREDLVEFMKMECQFQTCSCRMAERKGVKYEHDTSFMDEFLVKIREMEKALAEAHNNQEDEQAAGNASRISEKGNDQPDTEMDSEDTQEVLPPDENMTEVAFCPQTGTFHTINTTTTTQPVTSLEHSSNDHNTNTSNNDNAIIIPTKEYILPPPQPESTSSPARSPISKPAHIPEQTELTAPPTLPSGSIIPVLLPEQSSLLSLLSAPIQAEQLPAQQHQEEENEDKDDDEDEIPQARKPQPEAAAAAASSTRPAPPPSQEHPHHHHHHHHQRGRTRTTKTTTTLIPLADDDSSSQQQSSEHEHEHEHNNNQSLLAGTTMTRQQAIEQIRIRRGRARSIAAGALTPRKQMVDGAHGPGLAYRRDISAPGGKEKKWDD